MGYLGRRIGKSQNQGDSNPGGANGAVGGGILDLFANGYFEQTRRHLQCSWYISTRNDRNWWYCS